MTHSSDNLIKSITADTNSFKDYAQSKFPQQEKAPYQPIPLKRINISNDITTPIPAKLKNRSNNLSPKVTDQFAPEFRYLIIAQHDAGQAALIKSTRVFNSNFVQKNKPECTIDLVRHNMIINNVNTNISATIHSYNCLNAEVADVSFDNVNAVFFLFDANKKQNLYLLENYIHTLNIPANLHKVIVGTQIGNIDKYSDEDFEELDDTLWHAEEFAKNHEMQYLEIHANAMNANSLFTTTTQGIADQTLIFQKEFHKSIEQAIAKVDNYISERAANEDEYIGLFKQGYSRKQKLDAAKALKQTLLGQISYMDLLASGHIGPLTQGILHENVYRFALPVILSLNLIQLENFQLPEMQSQQRGCIV